MTQLEQRVGIIYVEPDPNTLSRPEINLLISFMMMYMQRDQFHSELALDGFYVTEGRRGIVSDSGLEGTIFTVYKLIDGQRTRTRAGFLYTFLQTLPPDYID